MDVPKYFITITLNPYFHKFSYKTQLVLSYQLIAKILKPCVSYELWPEFTLHGNVHYHGMFKITDKIKYYKTISKLRDIGHMKIEKPRSENNVLEYCQKDIDVTREVFEMDLPITNNHRVVSHVRNKLQPFYKDLPSFDKFYNGKPPIGNFYNGQLDNGVDK